MKTIAIVQARMGSTRLPNKVMKTINGVPMIELLLSRLSQSKELNEIVVATSKPRERESPSSSCHPVSLRELQRPKYNGTGSTNRRRR